MGQTKDLFISPLRHRLLYELLSRGREVSLGVGSGVDFATYASKGRAVSARDVKDRSLLLDNLAGLYRLYKTEINELEAELETTVRDQKKLNR